MAALFFETHATSLDNEAERASGWFDVDLSETGVRQAGELGDRHRASALSTVYCSDLLRARRTAEIAFAGTPIRILTDPRLRECDYGTLTRGPVPQVHGERMRRIADPFPGGESYEQATCRVGEWLDEIRRMPDKGPILVIGHRATWYALEHLLNGRRLADVIARAWQWQPGWRYSID